MATSYKTPGVYVEEISKFPPSVAQVETAIPAFIGYTEKATNKIKGDLKGIPTRISSLLDYETYFGYAKPETTISININDTIENGKTNRMISVNQPSSKQPFLMYYSMQIYFANGGGPCYIVSVGRYGDDLDEADTQVTAINNSDDFKTGLAEIEKVDEPTLIVFPDATALSTATEFYGLYNEALIQCNKLQDRFAIIDTKGFDATSPTDSNISDLRDNILSDKDYAKYGAAYYPFIETSLNYSYSANSVQIKHLTTEPKALESALEGLNESAANIPAKISALFDTSDLAAISGSLVNAVNYLNEPSGFNLSSPGSEDFSLSKASAFATIVEGAMESLKELIDLKTLIKNDANSVIASVEENVSTVTAVTSVLDSFLGDFETTSKIDEAYSNMVKLLAKLKKDDTTTKVGNTIKNATPNFNGELAKLAAYSAPVAPATTFTITLNAFDQITTKLGNIISAVNTASLSNVDTNNGEFNGRMVGDIENLDNATYNKILLEIDALPLTLPPSAAIAGVYARVDKDRGVWKAPANVGLNYVIKPSVKITHEMQEGLNVDTTAGKSINAIRAFTGKGTLVWGARTLAGNDNEWRYIPVRRFFNMVEESVKKATSQFVFEPNDANTWIKVRAMIENFLVLQWRAGALAGAKPEQAFYVRVGLGQTMTAQDILNGYMHVEIGMAVVRPAEFIVLKFSHKLQEA